MRLAATLLVVTLGSPLAAAQSVPITEEQHSRETPITRVARDVGPAVVNVYQEVAREIPWPYSQLWGRQTTRTTSLGSGVIIDPAGFVLTNAHVIKPQAEIQVRLANHTNFVAHLVNLDTANDVALLKIDAPSRLPSADLGTSSDVMVGETVVAIGNPLGNENSVTAGIVSSVFRDVQLPGRTGRAFKDFIQIDAAINPGNSGGPLLNVHGEVIGINWAIASEAEGIGFAIPIDRVRKSLVDKLLNPLVINEVITGFEIEGDPKGRNVRLSTVSPGSPADDADLRAGDSLVSVADVPIRWEFDFNKALFGAKPGDRVPVVVERSGRLVPTEIVLDTQESPIQFIQRTLGLRVVDDPNYYGVVVDSVDPRGPAGQLPIRRGDLIDGVNGADVDDTQDFFVRLRALPRKAEVTLHLFRDGRPLRGRLLRR